MIGFSKIKSPDRILNMIQDNLLKILNPITSNEVLNGQILTQIVLSSGANVIAHGLGRPLLGWYPVRIRANATLYDTQDTNPNPASTLYIHASAGVTVDLAVF